jgi:hypothetical protein
MFFMDKQQQQDIEREFIAMMRANERLIYKVCFYVTETSAMEDLYQEAAPSGASGNTSACTAKTSPSSNSRLKN